MFVHVLQARTVPRLPPIKKNQSNFVVPTEHDIKRHYREKDNKTHPHTSSVNCQCEMCTFNRRYNYDVIMCTINRRYNYDVITCTINRTYNNYYVIMSIH